MFMIPKVVGFNF